MNLMANKTKNNTALPFAVYFWTVAFLTTAGLADSICLAISHYRVYTDVAYSSFCAISKAINCDTVSQSSYSIFFNVPVPVWGIIGYTFFFTAFSVCLENRSLPPADMALTFSVVVSLQYLQRYSCHDFYFLCKKLLPHVCFKLWH